jgi:hypothetical protein
MLPRTPYPHPAAVSPRSIVRDWQAVIARLALLLALLSVVVTAAEAQMLGRLRRARLRRRASRSPPNALTSS